MALSSVRLRRAVSLSSSLIRHQTPFSAIPVIASSPSLSSVTDPQNPRFDLIQPHHHLLSFHPRHFRSSSVWFSSARTSFRNSNNSNDEIGPDTILFEGCDYNHWLITMDFPKDPKPTREEMIETYLQTLAKVVGSYEEAKKKMYAFSTTTFQGFQCLVTEEMSEKFKGLPGVVFVLPDSYIDPVNKEYGGDKYENGVITPRPPPPQYGRSGGRYGDRNRDFNRNRPRGPMPNQQGNQSFGNQGPMYGDARNIGQQQNSPMYGDARNIGQQQNSPMYGDTRNFGQQQNPPMQPNSGPMGAGDRRGPMPMNNAPVGRDSMPSYQAAYSQNEQGYYNPQGGSIPPQQRDYMPPGERHLTGDNRNYAPPQGGAGGNYGQMAGGNYRQGAGGNYGQMAGGNYGQGAGGNYGQMAGGNYGQGAGGNYGQMAGGNYGQGAGGNYGQMAGGNYGQGAGGNYGQGAGGNYGQGVGAAHGQETGSGNGQSYPGHGEDYRFSQVEQRSNMQGEQRNYAATTHTGTDQVRN